MPATGKQNVDTSLALALRRQRAKPLVSPYLSDAGAVIGRALLDADLLPLEVTDRLFGRYSEEFSSCTGQGARCHHQRVQSGSTPEFFSALRRLGSRITDPVVVLYGRLSEYTGALRLAPAELLSSAQRMLQLEVDHLRVSSVDCRCGLLIDHLARENELEFWLWGEEWLRVSDFPSQDDSAST